MSNCHSEELCDEESPTINHDLSLHGTLLTGVAFMAKSVRYAQSDRVTKLIFCNRFDRVPFDFLKIYPYLAGHIGIYANPFHPFLRRSL